MDTRNREGSSPMPVIDNPTSRRAALQCLAYGGAGTLFTLAGGVPLPFDLGGGALAKPAGKPFFVQISDSHIGFSKDANHDVNGTLTKTIDLVNALPEQPPLILHTGDITHLSKAEEFDTANQLLSGLRVSELHTTPGVFVVFVGFGLVFFVCFVLVLVG